jgi:hypothetical protein
MTLRRATTTTAWHGIGSPTVMRSWDSRSGSSQNCFFSFVSLSPARVGFRRSLVSASNTPYRALQPTVGTRWHPPLLTADDVPPPPPPPPNTAVHMPVYSAIFARPGSGDALHDGIRVPLDGRPSPHNSHARTQTARPLVTLPASLVGSWPQGVRGSIVEADRRVARINGRPSASKSTSTTINHRHHHAPPQRRQVRPSPAPGSPTTPGAGWPVVSVSRPCLNVFAPGAVLHVLFFSPFLFFFFISPHLYLVSFYSPTRSHSSHSSHPGGMCFAPKGAL